MVRLTSPAGPGGVTFDVATADGTALAANADYVPLALAGADDRRGRDRDGRRRQRRRRHVRRSRARRSPWSSATSSARPSPTTPAPSRSSTTTSQLTAIHAIQGPGATSPLVGASVTTRGVVTALKSNGFFLQTPDADADADPLTSEGIVVFTGSTLPAGGRRSGALRAGDRHRAGVRAERRSGAAAADRDRRRADRSCRSRPAIPLPAPIPHHGAGHQSGRRRSRRSSGSKACACRVASLTVTAPTQGFAERGRGDVDVERHLLRGGHRRAAAVPRAGHPGAGSAAGRRAVRRSRASTPIPSACASTATRSPARRPIDVPAGAVITGLVGVARLRLPHLHDPAGRRHRDRGERGPRRRGRCARRRRRSSPCLVQPGALLRHGQRSRHRATSR